MMVVKYLAELAGITGHTEEKFPLQPTVLDLLINLAKQYGSPLKHYFLNDHGDDVSDSIFVLLNGRHIRHFQGVQTVLQESDEISLIPIMEAG